MKKLLYSLSMLVCLLGVSENVWAADFYAALRVSVQSGGKIKVIREGESVMTDYSTYSTSQQTATSPSVARNSDYIFEIGATPAVRGKKFNGWSNFGGSGSAKFVSGYSKTSPIAKVTMKSSSGSLGGLFGGTNTATVTANFVDDPDFVDVTYLSAPAGSGSYTVTGPSGYGTVTIGNNSTYKTYSGDVLRLTATPAAGYTFIRFYTMDASGNVKTLGNLYETQQDVNIKNLDDMSGVVSVGVDIASQPFAIGARTFETLDAAIQAVKTSSNKTILVINNTTVAAGNYTLPSGVTLLVPKNATQTSPETTLVRTLDKTPTPSMYRKLTFANGANLIVNGSIEVGGTQSAGAQGRTGAGIPVGTYGQIELQAGSKVTLNNGANLRAWGFITGLGEIDARRGSKVYEQFQMYDWKGGSHSAGLLGNKKGVFPVNQYFIQNVEAPTTYHPGSSLIGATSIAVSNIEISGLSYTKTTIIISSNNIGIVGVDGTTSMFLMDEADVSEDTWVRKWYDTTNDKQVYEVNSSAKLGAMEINLSGVPILGDLDFDTQNYTLPITSNLKIHILDGKMGVKYNTVMLPGAEIEIDKTATVTIENEMALYLYDAEQWGKYIFSDAYAQPVLYSPSAPENHGRHTPVARAGSWVNSSGWWYVLDKPASATINVHGTFDVKGALYTTENGANIYSSIADAGTMYFSNAAAANSEVSQPSAYEVQTTDMIIVELPKASKITYATATCTSAKLKNDAGSAYSDGDGYSETAGTDAGQSFCFIDIDKDGKGEWVSLTTDGCFVYDSEGIYYAKPSDYVALQNGKTPNADHTYSSADGSRTFILICDDEQTDCQWWQVTYHEESGLYYCAKNGIYYFFDEDIDLWVEKKYTITWLNYDGNPVLDENDEEITYFVPYGSMPKYNNSTPTRQDDPGYYTYDFVRWTPEFTPVTSDVSYTAVYERNPVMYTITWKNANNTEREVGYFQRDSMPVCRTEPTGMGTSWEWSPVVEPVTGNKTYTLQAIVTPKTSFTVTWKNFNGSTLETLETDTDVPAGTIPTYNGEDPSKASLDDVRFIWNPEDGWTPAVSPVTADVVYVAKYTEQPITYAITWKNYDYTDLLVQNVTPNTVPQYTGATPTKPSDETYNYAFSGWDSEIVAATVDAIYTAQFSATPKDKSVSTAETVEEGKQQTVTNLTITSTGQLTIPSTSRINAENLILEGTNTTSGQLISNLNTSINTVNAYFDWTPNGNAGTQYRTWYAVAVPWEVNAETGIFIKDGRHLVLGSDFDLVWYDGGERAANGDGFNCWKYVEYETDKIMHPGKSYMMYFGPTGIQTIRFAKASGSAVIYNSPINVETYDLGTGVTTDANWNGIANPRTYYVSLGTGASFAQVLGNGSLDAYFANPEAPVYTTIDVDASKFIVGQPIFVQAVNPQPVVVTKETSAGIVNAAPRRARTNNLPDDIAARYAVHIALDGHASTDNLFIQVTEEEKEDTYVLGQDLSKGGVAKTMPQLWVNRYNSKLSVNTQSLTNDVAEYPLTIFAPKAGEYVINTENAYDDYDLYLTRNGEAVWNLSNGEFTFSLSQGNTSEYGLRLSARKSPSVATGVDEALVDAQGKTRKVIINDKVFIIRGENVYSIDGQLVK